MKKFYDLSIHLYGLIIRFASLFHPKAKLWVQGRKNTFDNLPNGKNDNIVWVHCASLGEYEQGKTLITAFQHKTDYKILLTFYSPSGYEFVKNKKIDWIEYLPLDTKKNAERFIEKVQPKMALFIKYEFWPNYLMSLNKHQIPTFNISGIFRENQYFFHTYGKWFKDALSSIEHFYVQDEHSKKVLNLNGIENASVSGDTRYDRVMENIAKTQGFDLIEKFKGDKKTIVCGSTWQKDVELVLAMTNRFPNLKFILAPHNLNQVKNINTGVCLSKTNVKEIDQYQVLVIDSIGILSQVYQYADVCYIGGGFGTGIHNILEAIAHEKPVVFGPKHHKFKEAKEALAYGIAKSISNRNELEQAIKEFLNEKPLNIHQFCKDRTGATEIIMKDLLKS